MKQEMGRSCTGRAVPDPIRTLKRLDVPCIPSFSLAFNPDGGTFCWFVVPFLRHYS
jgi:hypothetical protein